MLRAGTKQTGGVKTEHPSRHAGRNVVDAAAQIVVDDRLFDRQGLVPDARTEACLLRVSGLFNLRDDDGLTHRRPVLLRQLAAGGFEVAAVQKLNKIDHIAAGGHALATTKNLLSDIEAKPVGSTAC